jgi:hypothetical protein
MMTSKGMPGKKRTTNRELLEKIHMIENTLQADIKIVGAKVEGIDPHGLNETQVELQRQIEEVQQALIRVVNQWDYQLNYHRNVLAEVTGRLDLITGSIGESVPPAEEEPAILPMPTQEDMPAPSEEEASQPPPSDV